MNEEKFIQEAIDSVLAQTYDNWELLLVDDGSTDYSSEIARNLARTLPGKVHYLEHNDHQNKGKSVSRNLGIAYATGDYIAFLDADDVWLPHKLEEQVPILESHPNAAMLFGQTLYWYGWTGNDEDIKLDNTADVGFTPDTIIMPPELLISHLKTGKGFPSINSVLVRSTIVEQVGGFEETFRDFGEDLAFSAKIYLKYPVFVCSGLWDRYRKHPNSTCSIASADGSYDSGILVFLEWLEIYLSVAGITNPTLLNSLQNELRRYRHPLFYRALNQARIYIRHLKLFLTRVIQMTPSVQNHHQ